MINPIPGQEEENAEFLEESHVGIWLKKDDEFEKTIQNMLQQNNLTKLKENSKKIAKPNAAAEIYQIIFGEDGH